MAVETAADTETTGGVSQAVGDLRNAVGARTMAMASVAEKRQLAALLVAMAQAWLLAGPIGPTTSPSCHTCQSWQQATGVAQRYRSQRSCQVPHHPWGPVRPNFQTTDRTWTGLLCERREHTRTRANTLLSEHACPSWQQATGVAQPLAA
jgi:hypothetical protein